MGTADPRSIAPTTPGRSDPDRERAFQICDLRFEIRDLRVSARVPDPGRRGGHTVRKTSISGAALARRGLGDTTVTPSVTRAFPPSASIPHPDAGSSALPP